MSAIFAILSAAAVALIICAVMGGVHLWRISREIEDDWR